MYCEKLKSILSDTESENYGIDISFIRAFHNFLKTSTTKKERYCLNPIKCADELSISEKLVMKFFVLAKNNGLVHTRAFYNCECGEHYEIFSFSDIVPCPNKCTVIPKQNKDRVFIYFELLEEIEECDFLKEDECLMDYFDDSDLGKYEGTLADFEEVIGEAKANYLFSSQFENGKVEGNDLNNECIDIAVITALEDELIPIKNLIKPFEEICDEYDRSTYYYKGKFIKDGKEISVVAAKSIQMGMTAAAVLSTKLIHKFQPKYLVMTGIAAGVEGDDRNLGDILVANQSWDYGSGKIVEEEVIETNSDGIKQNKKVLDFKPSGNTIDLDSALETSFDNFKGKIHTFTQIKQDFEENGGTAPSTQLKLHIGPMASGASVVSNNEVIKMIKKQNNKLIGIEMETYAIFFAAKHCIGKRPEVFSLKSIVDFADSFKGDKYRKYAAYTSAKALYEFSFIYLYDDIKKKMV